MTATAHIRIGTASWTEKSLIKSGAFYPPAATTAEDRLRFYASRFDTVEVDSSYYAIPSERNAFLWAERTPPGFVFHMKAYSMLTGHPTLVKTIPKVLRDRLPAEVTDTDKIKQFPEAVVREAAAMFSGALRPLRREGKLGCLLFQFPPWFVPSDDAYRRMAWVREQFTDDELAVEFRNTRWLSPSAHRRALGFLKDMAMTYVAVDGPWIPDWQGPEPTAAPIAYVRLHGRNRKNWFRKGIETVERYRYLYNEQELKGWADRIRRTAAGSQQVYVLFNNCYEDMGIRNAQAFRRLLGL